MHLKTTKGLIPLADRRALSRLLRHPVHGKDISLQMLRAQRSGADVLIIDSNIKITLKRVTLMKKDKTVKIVPVQYLWGTKWKLMERRKLLGFIPFSAPITEWDDISGEDRIIWFDSEEEALGYINSNLM
jgi:hypothetical protein